MRWLTVKTKTCRTFQLNYRAWGLSWPLSKELVWVVLLTHTHNASPERWMGLLTLTPPCNHILFDKDINILLLREFESSESASVPFFSFTANPA